MFSCSLGCQHALDIERRENKEGTEWQDPYSGPIEVNIWHEPQGLLRERLINAWRVLRGRPVITEGICLMHAEAQEMGRFLLAISSAIHPKDVEWASAANLSSSHYCSCLTFSGNPKREE